MHKIAISAVIPPTEQFDPEEIKQLVESIREKGLLHSIIVHQVNNGSFEILVGKRRFVAMRELGFPVVDAEIREGEISADDKVEMSIHENLKRGNMPWHEQVKLVAQLHELRQRQHGDEGRTERGRPKEEAKWTLRDTVEELNKFSASTTSSLGAVSQDLRLAAELVVDPSLAKVKDKTTALKLIRLRAKRHTAEEDTALGNFGIENQILLGDSSEVLKHVPEETFHACITDPPWLNFAPAQGTGLTRDESTLPVFEQVYRTLRPDSMLFAVVSLDDFNFYYDELPKFGFRVQRTPIIWVKTGGLSRRGMAAWQFARDYEFILVAAKGAPVLTTLTQQSSIFTYDVIPSVKLIHPHEKPPALIARLLDLCTYENAHVLEPFAGSFVVPETCREHGRKFTAIEREHEFFERGKKRLGM